MYCYLFEATVIKALLTAAGIADKLTDQGES